MDLNENDFLNDLHQIQEKNNAKVGEDYGLVGMSGVQKVGCSIGSSNRQVKRQVFEIDSNVSQNSGFINSSQGEI